MLSNDELKEKFIKIHPEYFKMKVTKSGKINYNWDARRVFQCIIYPESMKSDINTCAKDFGVPFVVGLHNMDCNKDTGEKDKDHYHLVAQYEGKTTLYKFYSDIVRGFGENAWFGLEYTSNKTTSIQYLIHRNDPDKYQYSIDNVSGFNGMDFKDDLLKSNGDVMSSIDELEDIIDKNCIFQYVDLVKYLKVHERFDLREILIKDSHCSKHINHYLRSMEHCYFYDGTVEKVILKFILIMGQRK